MKTNTKAKTIGKTVSVHVRVPEQRVVDVRKRPKRLSEFRQVREGSFRADVLRAMNGQRTPAQIAALGERSRALIMSHAFCLFRDCGIGYGLTEDGCLTAIFPRGKTLQDAIRRV